MRKTLAYTTTVALLAVGVAQAEIGTGGDVHVNHSGHEAERTKKLPITTKRGRKPRVVISLGPGAVGKIVDGDRVEGAGEGQVTVCLKANPRHPASRDDCVGRVYGFDPKIEAYVVLAASKGVAKGPRTMRISRKVSRKCTQKQPARNHHCVLTAPWGGIDVADTRDLPCAPDSCYLNLVMSAWHKKAKSGNTVAIGGIEDGKIDHKGHGSVVVARYRPGDLERPQPTVDRSPAKRRLGIAGDDKDVEPKSIYSVPVERPRAGDVLVVEGMFASSIKHLDYNVRTRSQLIFAASRKDAETRGGSPAAKVAETSIDLDEQNNFNCTQKSSGHKTPCPIRKVGILEIRNSSSKTFFINLIAGHGALLVGDQKRHGSDAATLKGSAGYLKVWRYRRP